MAVIFGLSATVLIALVGAGIDYARLNVRQRQLQSAVDAGVLAGGNALKLAMATTVSVAGVTEHAIRSEAKTSSAQPLSVQVAVADDRTSVSAVVQEDVKLMFGNFVGLSTVALVTRAKASVVGRMRLCMLTLDEAASGAFNLEKNAQVTARDCALYSNSKSGTGMLGQANAMALAQTICSAGGYSGARANFAPPPQTGCPVIADPLRDRAGPQAGPCTKPPATAYKSDDDDDDDDEDDDPEDGDDDSITKSVKNIVNRTVTLDPGTYCGGLYITDYAKVTLRPGIYVIKDGPLLVGKQASVSGVDVGFYFIGDKSGLVFEQKTTISLSAPTSGLMAGLLMAEDRNVANPVAPPLNSVTRPTPPSAGGTTKLRLYRIISDNARTMLGTIYLPSGRVVIDASKPVADQSAYTVIVARQVNLYEGPNLYLNSNYGATSVPVPPGVGPLAGKLLLTQ